MASLQIAVDTPFCTKKEFLRRTGWSSASLERAIKAGEIPIMPKKGANNSVLINMVKMFESAVGQQV
ncbi:Rha family transcriptional regulator [Photobacterium sp. GJ3]|uniref:Rha family transcriptional regulator n=1 Tax=Photobacterium sp. GJ3 TaxID=2829502 RepID=UPI001B8AF860|nr:Rha family transcriptional regulator [Photobacterium sp. GJ3]QUJ68262.1 Rha family transcriptional regulator [Photobacterium sp. GJ3]